MLYRCVMTAYDLDFHDWALAQADAIRRRSANEIDWNNLAEEVESLGRSQRSSLRSHLTILAAHLLKWERQPERRSHSWRLSIVNARSRIPGIMEDSPSLRPQTQALFDQAYRLARQDAANDMNVDVRQLPAEPPFTLEDALDARWLEGFLDWDAELGVG